MAARGYASSPVRSDRRGYAPPSVRSASPVRSDRRGFAAGVRDVGHKIRQFYTFELMPKTFVVKFRQQVQGIQLGANFEFDGMQVDARHLQKCHADECHTKLIVKPCSENGYWKVVGDPKERDLQILTKKIPLGSLLHFQFGIGHDFNRNITGWKWKVTSAFGLPGSPEFRQKTKLPVFPGFDINVHWNAHYELPEAYGSSGDGEPPVGVNLGHLHARIERVAAVYTHFG